MSWDLITVLVGLSAGLAGVLWTVVKMRSDWHAGSATEAAEERAEVKEALTLKNEVIAALREANDEQRRQLAQALDREQQWQQERDDYKTRLAELEKQYRSLVEAVVEAGICAIALTCDRRVMPGERRGKRTAGG